VRVATISLSEDEVLTLSLACATALNHIAVDYTAKDRRAALEGVQARLDAIFREVAT
jgi:hypothetical protein